MVVSIRRHFRQTNVVLRTWLSISTRLGEIKLYYLASKFRRILFFNFKLPISIAVGHSQLYNIRATYSNIQITLAKFIN